MPSSETVPLDVAASNIGSVRDPHAKYAAMRRATPVARTSHLGADVTMVYGFDEGEAVLRDGQTYSCAINGRWMRPLLGRTILEMDGAEHLRMRSLVTHIFRPRIVAAWEEEIVRPTAHDLVDAFAGRGAAELVRELAWELPVRVFARILGVPSVDHAAWNRWAVELETASADWHRAVTASEQVRRYFAAVVEERRAGPARPASAGRDLIGELLEAEVDGRGLDEDLIHGFLRLLVPAGAATTYRLLGTLLFALLGDGDQLDAVRTDRALIPAAVEEALRWESPVQFAAREATRDTELAGAPVAAGTPVVVALGSANRDERRWAGPDHFDLRRAAHGHLAFGGGPHYCLGAHLARIEAAAALDVLLDRLADLRLEPGDLDPHIVGYAFRSPTALPVSFRAS